MTRSKASIRFGWILPMVVFAALVAFGLSAWWGGR